MQSWRIIQQAMPAQLNTLAESLLGAGKKSEDLYTAWQKGNITTEQVIDAFIRLDKEGSGSVASFEEQAHGSSEGIKTSWGNIQLTINCLHVLSTSGRCIYFKKVCVEKNSRLQSKDTSYLSGKSLATTKYNLK